MGARSRSSNIEVVSSGSSDGSPQGEVTKDGEDGKEGLEGAVGVVGPPTGCEGATGCVTGRRLCLNRVLSLTARTVATRRLSKSTEDDTDEEPRIVQSVVSLTGRMKEGKVR